MNKSLLLLIIVLSALTVINAQVPRKVLMEYATNASCGPCAAYNPGSYSYLKSNSDHIVAVWYHAWWPGSDPMYSANIPENRNRIIYYGVNGVPNYMIDGIYQGNPGSISTLSSNVDTRYALESPISISIDQEIVGDTLDINIELNVESEVTATNLWLRSAIVEQNVKYNSPPGSNGEKEFPQVFRKFCVDTLGINLSGLSVGNKLTYNLKEQINENWNKGVLGVVSWVQSDDTKEVLQAESTLEITHELKTDESKFETVDINSTIIKNLVVENFKDEPMEVLLNYDVYSLQDSWECTLQIDDEEAASKVVTLGAGESKSFSLLVKTSDQFGEFEIQVNAEDVNSPIHLAPSEKFYGIAYGGDVMVMDADPETDFEQEYIRILEKIGKSKYMFGKQSYSKVAGIVDLSEFKTIIWVLGPGLPTLQSSELTAITNYLGGGGNIFIASPDLAHDMVEVQNSTAGKFFLRYNLDAKYVADSSEVSDIEAVEGNPLFDDFSFQITSAYPSTNDVITLERGTAIPVLKYAGTDNYGMLIHQKLAFKTAYMTFSLDQIPSEAQREQLLEAVLNWFEDPTGTAENSDGLPMDYALGQNYPNPFNPSTVINYQLADGANVNLSVYNAIGEKVAVLVNEYKSAGYYSVNFNALNLSSGIYFYRISANDFYQVKKMLFVK